MKLKVLKWVERITFYVFLALGSFLFYLLLMPLTEISRLLQRDAALNIVFLMVGIMLGGRWVFYSKFWEK